MGKFYALWVTSDGQRMWAGPFAGNVAAAGYLATVDTSGGSLVAAGIPMTLGEAREARRAEAAPVPQSHIRLQDRPGYDDLVREVREVRRAES